MSKSTKIIGIILILAGLGLSFIHLILIFETSFLFLIYGIPLLVFGIIIFLNKKEDVIEQIKSTGGKK